MLNQAFVAGREAGTSILPWPRRSVCDLISGSLEPSRVSRTAELLQKLFGPATAAESFPAPWKVAALKLQCFRISGAGCAAEDKHQLLCLGFVADAPGASASRNLRFRSFGLGGSHYCPMSGLPSLSFTGTKAGRFPQNSVFETAQL